MIAEDFTFSLNTYHWTKRQALRAQILSNVDALFVQSENVINTQSIQNGLR